MKKRKSHRCVEEMNKLLATRGEELDLAFNLKGETFMRIKTYPLGHPERKGKLTVVPNYCPFCGLNLKVESESKGKRKKHG